MTNWEITFNNTKKINYCQNLAFTPTQQAPQKEISGNDIQSNDLEDLAEEAIDSPTMDTKQAEQDQGDINCELCDFRNSWRIFEVFTWQLDRNFKSNNDSKYFSTKHYWKTGYLGTHSKRNHRWKQID